MSNIHIRRRGVALVETEEGILMVRENGKPCFSLPGGKANSNETRLKASMRELQEETGMIPLTAEYLCEYVGREFTTRHGQHFQNHAKVFVVKAKGIASVMDKNEISKIAWWKPGCDLPLCDGIWKSLKAYDDFKRGSSL